MLLEGLQFFDIEIEAKAPRQFHPKKTLKQIVHVIQEQYGTLPSQPYSKQAN